MKPDDLWCFCWCPAASAENLSVNPGQPWVWHRSACVWLRPRQAQNAELLLNQSTQRTHISVTSRNMSFWSVVFLWGGQEREKYKVRVFSVPPGVETADCVWLHWPHICPLPTHATRVYLLLFDILYYLIRHFIRITICVKVHNIYESDLICFNNSSVKAQKWACHLQY